MIRKGNRGKQVLEVQLALLSKGFELPRFGADSDFGGETEAAVRAYQLSVGLVDTGIVDGVTAAFLMSGGGDGTVGPTGPRGPTGQRGPRGYTPDLADYDLVKV